MVNNHGLFSYGTYVAHNALHLFQNFSFDESRLLFSCEVKLSMNTNLMAHLPGAYPGFCTMKWLWVFLLPSGLDASQLQITPALSLLVPIYTPGRREALWEWSVLPKNTTQCPWLGLNPGLLNPACGHPPPIDATIIVSNKCPNIGEQVVATFVT